MQKVITISRFSERIRDTTESLTGGAFKISSPQPLAVAALMVLGCAGFTASAGAQTLIPVSDPNWYFSPYNWNVVGSSYAETPRPGAYFKIGFTGTSIAAQFDTTMLSWMQASSYPTIRYQIDDQPTQDYELHRWDGVVNLNSKALDPGQHTLTVWTLGMDPGLDRWDAPLANEYRILGLVADDGATTFRPSLSPHTIMFLGDSITEGLNDVKCGGNTVDDNDAVGDYTHNCAAALNAECGVVAAGGQCWTRIAHDGHTPPLPQSWKWLFQGVPRDFSTPPDYLVAMEGGIDLLFTTNPPAVIQSTIESWLTDARATLPTTKIFLAVTFNGFYEDVITAAYNDYKQANPLDSNMYLIDLGPAGQDGLLMYFSNQGSLYTCDGIHPLLARQAVLGQMLGQAMLSAMGQ